jgi:ABC-type amino acid transport substrate-binding protein
MMLLGAGRETRTCVVGFGAWRRSTCPPASWYRSIIMQSLSSSIALFRKLCCGAALAWLCGSMPVHAHEFRMGYFELPARARQGADGHAEGPAIERFKDIAEKMGLKNVVFVRFPFARMLAELENKRIDAALILGKSPDRDAKFHYPKRPFFVVQSGLIVRADSPIADSRDLPRAPPMVVGVMLGSNLTPSMMNPNLQVEYLPGDNPAVRNLEKLLRKRLDAVYTPDVDVAFYDVTVAGAARATRVIALPDPPTPIFSVFTKEQGALLGEKYDRAVEAVAKEKGAYGQLLDF